jgi:uncharacterized delta-60 repeat protein
MTMPPDGRLDTDCSGDGRAVIDNGAHEEGRAVAVQPDGKLVVAGVRSGEWYAARLNADCTLDTSFNSPNGYIAFTQGGGYDYASAIAIQDDGKIVLVGRGSDAGAVARLNANGTLDTATFGGGTGRVVTTIPAAFDEPDFYSVAIQDDGRIVVVGEVAFGAGNPENLILRYLPDGSLDTSFSGDGWDASMGGDSFDDVLLTSTGMILAAGSDNFGTHMQVAAFDSSGSLDTAWNGSGVINVAAGLFAPGSGTGAHSLAELADGRIVAVGDNDAGGDWSISIARFLADGTLDTSFQGDGAMVYNPTPDRELVEVFVTATGHLFLAGRVQSGCCWSDVLAARLTAAGAPDPSFDGDGFATAEAGGDPGSNGGLGAAQLAGDEIVVVGQAHVTFNQSLGVVQFGGASVSDYANLGGGGDTDWSSGPTTNAFGACLRAVGGGATVDGSTWATDSVDGDCADGDGDPWRAIPATTGLAAARVANSPSTSTTSRVDLAFGFKASQSQSPGAYVAPIVFEVVAPAA